MSKRPMRAKDKSHGGRVLVNPSTFGLTSTSNSRTPKAGLPRMAPPHAVQSSWSAETTTTPLLGNRREAPQAPGLRVRSDAHQDCQGSPAARHPDRRAHGGLGRA